jgi:predicted 2-oxoglutarate/Fe(II)-dependent dioxygenase YbiX
MNMIVNGLFPGEICPSTTVAGCIEIFENVWPNPEETIRVVEETCNDENSGAYWQRASTFGHGVKQDVRTNKLVTVTHLAEIANNRILQNIHNQFYVLLLATTIPYASRHNINEGLWHEGYNLLKYSDGQEYKAHYDSNSTIGRAISAVCYLNNDYIGGEIEFVNFKVKIKPEPGMLILFPSNFAYSHVAHPVTEGDKYALVTWIRDRPINENIR